MNNLGIHSFIMKLLILLLSLLATTGCSSEGSATTADTLAQAVSPSGLIPNAIISKVIDGDTVIANIDGSNENVRLIGVDTPESVARNRPVQCFGAEAGDYLKTLLPKGTPVTLILDEEPRDHYDRLLAYVIRSHDDLFINLDLLEQGYAGILSYPPNTHYKELFGETVKTATLEKRGLWGVCGDPDVPLE